MAVSDSARKKFYEALLKYIVKYPIAADIDGDSYEFESLELGFMLWWPDFHARVYEELDKLITALSDNEEIDDRSLLNAKINTGESPLGISITFAGLDGDIVYDTTNDDLIYNPKKFELNTDVSGTDVDIAAINKSIRPTSVVKKYTDPKTIVNAIPGGEMLLAQWDHHDFTTEAWYSKEKGGRLDVYAGDGYISYKIIAYRVTNKATIKFVDNENDETFIDKSGKASALIAHLTIGDHIVPELTEYIGMF